MLEVLWGMDPVPSGGWGGGGEISDGVPNEVRAKVVINCQCHREIYFQPVAPFCITLVSQDLTF